MAEDFHEQIAVIKQNKKSLNKVTKHEKSKIRGPYFTCQPLPQESIKKNRKALKQQQSKTQKGTKLQANRVQTKTLNDKLLISEIKHINRNVTPYNKIQTKQQSEKLETKVEIEAISFTKQKLRS